MSQRERFTRRDFLKASLLATSSLLIPSCSVGKELPHIKLETQAVFLKNDWEYQVSFDSYLFLDVLEEAGVDIMEGKPVAIVLTNSTTAYETPHETQSHTVVLSKGLGPDRIEISCGRYVELVRQVTGREPQTPQDELFISVALSESIFNGYVDLAAERKLISFDEAYAITERYNERLLEPDYFDPSLVFAWVKLVKDEPPRLDEEIAGGIRA